MMLTLADAIEALTDFRPHADAVISEAGVDSRQAAEGSLFVAIRGEHVDGHDFVAQAFQRGAAFALIQRDVDDSLRTVDLRGGLSAQSKADLTAPSVCAWRTR